MDLELDEYGRVLPGQKNPDGSDVSQEQVIDFYATKAQQAKDLERKLSTQGEELSSTRAALDGYRRGQDGGGDGGGRDDDEQEFPDPLERPGEFKKAVKEQIQNGIKSGLQNLENVQAAKEASVKNRELFFSKYPDLRDWEKLVDYVSFQYMQIHSNDPLLTENPEKFRDQAFTTISGEVLRQLKDMYGTIPKKGVKAPFFETGGTSGNLGRRDQGENLNGFTTEEELHDQELTEYVASKGKARNAQK